jgi:hypothetical protein
MKPVRKLVPGYSVDSSADFRMAVYVNGSFVGLLRESHVVRLAESLDSHARTYASDFSAVNLDVAGADVSPFDVAVRLVRDAEGSPTAGFADA